MSSKKDDDVTSYCAHEEWIGKCVITDASMKNSIKVFSALLLCLNAKIIKKWTFITLVVVPNWHFSFFHSFPIKINDPKVKILWNHLEFDPPFAHNNFIIIFFPSNFDVIKMNPYDSFGIA